MFRKVSYAVNNQFKSYNIPSNRLVYLKGNKVDCDTFLSVIERCIASDFSSYFDEYDISKGLTYNEVENVHLEFDYGSLSFINNKYIKRLATHRDFYCIRYINDLNIRSFISPLTEKEIPSSLGVSLTQYSSALSKSSWLRLKELFNNMCGFDAVTLDFKNKVLNLNFSGNDEWSEDALKLAYLVLSESFVSARRGIRIILLSEISIMSEMQFIKLLDALYHVSNLECIFFTNKLTSIRGTKLSDLGILTI